MQRVGAVVNEGPGRPILGRCLAATVSLFLAACGGGGSSTVSAPPTGTASSAPQTTDSESPTPVIEATPADGFRAATFDVAFPQGFAAGFGSVWVPGHRDGTISRIDSRTNEVVAIIEGVGYQAQDVAIGDGSVWVPASGADYVARIDPSKNRVVSEVRVGPVSDVDFGLGSLWAATKDMRLLRIDPATEHVVAEIQVGPSGGNDCNNSPEVTARWVWVSVCDTGMLVQVDPSTNDIVRKVDIGGLFDATSGWGIIASADALWVVVGNPGVIARLDPGSGEVARRADIGLAATIGGFMALDDDALWLGGDGILTRFDAQSLEILDTYQVTNVGEVDPGVGFGSVWAMVFDRSEVDRFDFPVSP